MLHAIVAASALALTGPQTGNPAPAFHLVTVTGKSVSLADFAGKTLVLNDWATWCPPCREETPDLIATAKKLGARGDVAFLGIDSTEAAPIVRAFIASKGVPYPQAIDRDHAFARAYDVRAFPSTFVIGPDGVLRARFVGNIDPRTLSDFIADARSGRNATVANAAQAKVDALLAPGRFSWSGDAVTVRKNVHAMLAAFDAADNVDGTTDYLRTQAEENALRDAAIAAFSPLAATDADRALVARLRGDAATAREQWADAVTSYRAGLALTPKDADLVGGLAFAYAAQHDYARAAREYAAFAALRPSVDASIDLGDALGKAGRYTEGAKVFAQATARGRAAVDAHPHDAKALRALAAAYLYQGRLYARAGDTEQARRAFANVTKTALRLPKTNSRYAMDLEEAQEATIALDTARPAAGKAALSVAPWTGPDLPGSVASTYKYRLIVAGTPGRTVALAATGLPSHWVASFCNDARCAPFRTSVALPSTGVKIVEFQLIPESALRAPATIRISGGGARVAVTVPARG